MTSHMYERPKEGTKASVPHASFAEALVGGIGSSATCFYIWDTHYGANMAACVAKQDFTLRSCFVKHEENPWGNLVTAVVIISALTFISSWVLRFAHGRSAADPSVVDRLWSIVPWCYAWYMAFAASTGAVSTSTFHRLLIIAVLSTAWGARLTWNFARKGGFSGGEDYRWVEVQSWMTPVQFEVFNLVFITTYQHYLLLAITTPLAVVWSAGASGGDAAPLGPLDIFATGLYALLVFGEYTADCQMFDFQTEKYRRKNAGEPLGADYKKGFITTGLWAWSRHPNYFCEVSLWWTFYLFGVAASGEWLNASLVGAILLTILFVPPKASLDTTESLSSRKYPEYKEYQKTTSRFFPWPPQ